MEILIGILTIVLVIVSVLMILVVLMQRGSANGGLGAAMGGGMAESALGAETSTVLSRWTRNIAIVFFVLVFGLYLGRLYTHERALEANEATLPDLGGATDSNAAATSALQELISSSESEQEDASAEAAAPEDVEAAAPAAGDAEEAPEAPAQQ